MIGVFPGLSPSKGPLHICRPKVCLGKRRWPCLSTLTKVGTKLALQKSEGSNYLDYQSLLYAAIWVPVEQNGFLVAPSSCMQLLKLGVFPLNPRISVQNFSH